MPHHTAPPDAPPPGPRRGFLGQLVAAAIAVATGAALRPTDTMAAIAPNDRLPGIGPDTAGAPRGPWDLSWVDKLTARHRQVFDSTEIGDGAVLGKAALYLDGYHEVYGVADSDVNVVIALRHHAVPMALASDVWARYDYVGEHTKLKDPTTGHLAKRNPFIGVKADDPYALTTPDGTLDRLVARGAIILACNLALGAFAAQIADNAKTSVDAVRAELERSLVPGVSLVPSGVFGVARAEEAGCHYLAPS